MWLTRDTRVTLEEEFKRNPELNQDDLDHLKAWLQKQPHLPEIDDLELVLFLHSCHFKLEPTKATIDTAYTARTHLNDLFKDRDPTSTPVKQAMETAYFIPLEERTPEGYRVINCRLRRTDPSLLNYAEEFKIFFMVADLWMRAEGTAEGFVMVFDMEEVAFGHLLRLTPGPLSKFLFYLQDAMPVRIKGLHFINTVSFMDKFLALMKPFMKKELLDMLHLHSTVDTLEPFVPRKIMFKDYGGAKETREESYVKVLKIINDEREWLLKEMSRRVVESKRQGKSKSMELIEGLQGSFKKLDID